MEIPNLPASLVEAQIQSSPRTAYYIPDFITPSEETVLLQKINAAPLPTWRHLSHRRLQTYPSPLTQQNTLLASPLPTWLSRPIVPRLLSLPVSPETPSSGNLTSDSDARQSNRNVFITTPHHAPNHVLVNEYLPGSGIFPHEDGAAYAPIVATVSLGSHTVLDIYAKKEGGGGEREPEPRWRILQERRSLLITTGGLYGEYLHGIEGVVWDEKLKACCNWELVGDRENFEHGRAERGTRVSLTFRDVLKVKSLGKAFSGLLEVMKVEVVYSTYKGLWASFDVDVGLLGELDLSFRN